MPINVERSLARSHPFAAPFSPLLSKDEGSAQAALQGFGGNFGKICGLKSHRLQLLHDQLGRLTAPVEKMQAAVKGVEPEKARAVLLGRSQPCNFPQLVLGTVRFRVGALLFASQ